MANMIDSVSENSLPDIDFFTSFIDQETAVGVPVDKIRNQERHFEREIMLTLHGNCNFNLNGKGFTVTPGTVCFIDHWISHSQFYDGCVEDFRSVWIHFHRAHIFGSAIHWKGPDNYSRPEAFVFPSDLLSVIERRWDFASHLPADDSRKKDIYASIVRLLWDEMIFGDFAHPQARTDRRAVLEQVANYIAVNYGRNSSMEQLEAVSGYNRYHLLRLFKVYYGVTVREYITQVRRGFVQTATANGMSRKEIAYQLGFKSSAAFWLWYHRDKEREPSPTVIAALSKRTY